MDRSGVLRNAGAGTGFVRYGFNSAHRANKNTIFCTKKGLLLRVGVSHDGQSLRGQTAMIVTKATLREYHVNRWNLEDLQLSDALQSAEEYEWWDEFYDFVEVEAERDRELQIQADRDAFYMREYRQEP